MDKAGSTVTEILPEEAVAAGVESDVVPESVKVTYTPVSTDESVYVAVGPVPEAPVIGPEESYHCHVKEPVPPVAVEVTTIDCPESIVAD